MSGGAHVAIGGAAAAIAARQAELLRKEEEEMTTYGKDDIDGWEFKIVRANTEYFKRPENLRRVVEEEGRAGWELVEKFDNNRVRFKRRIDERKNDQHRQGIDPYRTQVGLKGAAFVLVVLAIIALALGGIILAIASVKGNLDPSFPMVLIPIIIIFIGFITFLILRAK